MPSLAARCPACITVFRVVPDQLRVSAGWVRCGRCAEVFNATETLIDLETGAPPLTVERALAPEPAAPPAAQSTAMFARPAGTLEADPPPHVAEHETLDIDEPALPPEAETDLEPLPENGLDFELEMQPQAHTSEPEPALTPVPTPALAAEPEDAIRRAGRESLPRPRSEEDARDEPVAKPSFVRRAESAERWRRPRVRVALALAVLVGLLVLAGQVVFEYREAIAARSPEARTALRQACAQLGCRIDALHAIDSLAVESSGLVRVEKSSVYKLSLALRNRAAFEVALPALDLMLTDSQGKLLARRVLRSAELGTTRSTLAAGGELLLQATLQAAFAGGPDAAVAGYTVELFYP